MGNNYLIIALVFFPFAAGIVSYIIGRFHKTARDLFLYFALALELAGACLLYTSKYIVYSIGGAAFAFIAMVFMMYYGTSLDFTFGGVLDMLQVAGHEQWLLVVFVLAFFGFGVKAAVFPLSGWLPSAGVAPTPVTALLHAVAVVNAGVYALVRLIYYTFGTEFLSGSWAQYVVMSAALVTIVYGSSMALRTPHLKRRLAYSTVSNLSYMVFGLTLMTPAGMVGGLDVYKRQILHCLV